MWSYPHSENEIWTRRNCERNWWACYHYHIPEVNHSIQHLHCHKPRVSSSSPPNQCNLEHFSLIISSLTKILIFNFCNADIRRHVKILGSKIIMWKKCYVFHHEQNIAHFIIKYLLHVFVQWTHLPKTLDLLFLLQGRVLLLLLFLFCFVFLNDIFPESSCDNT